MPAILQVSARGGGSMANCYLTALELRSDTAFTTFSYTFSSRLCGVSFNYFLIIVQNKNFTCVISFKCYLKKRIENLPNSGHTCKRLELKKM